jgi:hypothetical protein
MLEVEKGRRKGEEGRRGTYLGHASGTLNRVSTPCYSKKI